MNILTKYSLLATLSLLGYIITQRDSLIVKDSLITAQGKVPIFKDSKGKLFILRGTRKQYITLTNPNIVKK